MAFSPVCSGATGVKLTDDELGFQHFSAPTHPTGYMWKEKQVKSKVNIIRKKNVQTMPVKQFHLITTHPHNINISVFLNSNRSDTAFHFATKKLVKQSYQQVVLWCLSGLSNPMKKKLQCQTHSSNRLLTDLTNV